LPVTVPFLNAVNLQIYNISPGRADFVGHYFVINFSIIKTRLYLYI